MSAATKRKHVVKEVLDDFVLPEDQQYIVKITASRGNNLHEVQTDTGDKFLVSMPTKFRKNVWIKRGDYVLVNPISEGEKVKGEIIAILYKQQIQYIQEQGLWPAAFTDVIQDKSSESLIPDDMLPPSDSDSDDNLGDKVVNTNRQYNTVTDSEDSETDIPDQT